jgi:hypothetical protein
MAWILLIAMIVMCIVSIFILRKRNLWR